MKKTFHIRVSAKWHTYAKETAKARNKYVSQITEEALRMHSGEHKIEKEEVEAKYKALFPNGHKVRDPLNVSETQSAAELSTILDRLRGDNWLSRQNEDNDNNTKI